MIGELFPGLVGHLRIMVADSHGDLFTRNLCAVVVELSWPDPDGPPIRAGWFSVSRTLLEEIAPGGEILPDLIFASLDPVFRPWCYPDPGPFPLLDLFPRVTRMSEFAARWSGKFWLWISRTRFSRRRL